MLFWATDTHAGDVEWNNWRFLRFSIYTAEVENATSCTLENIDMLLLMWN